MGVFSSDANLQASARIGVKTKQREQISRSTIIIIMVTILTALTILLLLFLLLLLLLLRLFILALLTLINKGILFPCPLLSSSKLMRIYGGCNDTPEPACY